VKNPKNEAWLYLIVGVVAIGMGAYNLVVFAGDSGNILDWVIVAMGAVAVWRGIKQFWDLRAQAGGSNRPGEGSKKP